MDVDDDADSGDGGGGHAGGGGGGGGGHMSRSGWTPAEDEALTVLQCVRCGVCRCSQPRH